MRLGILARMANLLSFLCVFLLFLPGTTFTEYGKILFLRILQDFELFLSASIMPGAAISPWERLPFTLQVSQWKRPEHFISFLLTDVIIYLECCVPNFPLNYKLLPFSNSCDEFKVTKCCTKSISLLTLGTVRFYGYGGGGGGGGGVMFREG